MAQYILALAPAESPSWVHRIHIMAHNGTLYLQFQRIQYLLVDYRSTRYLHGLCTCVPTLIHIKEKSINLNNSVNSLHPHGCATACQTDRLSCGGLHLAEGHLQGKQYPAQAANHSVGSVDLWPPHDCSQHCPPLPPPHYGTRQHYDLLRLQVSMRSLFHSKAFFLLKVVESLLTSSCLNCHQENG